MGIKSHKRLQVFKPNQFIVYPAHGVGQVTSLEKETIAGFDIEVYVVSFEQEKMILRVPTNKASLSGMRSLSNENILKDSFTTLKGRARIKRTMWSRRAQEYEGTPPARKRPLKPPKKKRKKRPTKRVKKKRRKLNRRTDFKKRASLKGRPVFLSLYSQIKHFSLSSLTI